MYIEERESLTEREDLISLSVMNYFLLNRVIWWGNLKYLIIVLKWKEQAMMQFDILKSSFLD